jgi:hypothetical protein
LEYLREAEQTLTKVLEIDVTTRQLTTPQRAEIKSLIAAIPTVLAPVEAGGQSPLVSIHRRLVLLRARAPREWSQSDLASARAAIAEAARLSGVDLTEPENEEPPPMR